MYLALVASVVQTIQASFTITSNQCWFTVHYWTDAAPPGHVIDCVAKARIFGKRFVMIRIIMMLWVVVGFVWVRKELEGEYGSGIVL